MEDKRTTKTGSIRARRALLLVLLICVAAFLMFMRFKTYVPAQISLSAENLEEPYDANGSRLEIVEEDIEEIPEEIPEEIVNNEEETVPEEQEESSEPRPVLHEEKDREQSFYQKLRQGCNVNILIMGDLTAMGKGASEVGESADGQDHRWFVRLSDYLRESYLNGQTPYISSLASENASVFQDTLLLKSSTDETDYDLILFSYGLNEQTKDDMAFEALILSLHEKYPNASFITTLEPCFHKMTATLISMRDISLAYGFPVVNLFGRFYDNSDSMEEYLSNFDTRQTLPGDKGQELWFELLKSEIDANVEAATGKLIVEKPIDAKASQFAKMKYFSVEDSAVRRMDDTSFEIDAEVNGLAYMVHRENIGNPDAKVIADDILYSLGKPRGTALVSGDYLSLIYTELISSDSFTIRFSGKEYADGLRGFYLYCPEESE